MTISLYFRITDERCDKVNLCKVNLCSQEDISVRHRNLQADVLVT